MGRDFPPPIDLDLDLGSLDENAYRLIKYEFSEDVLRLPSIQVGLVKGQKQTMSFIIVLVVVHIAGAAAFRVIA